MSELRHSESPALQRGYAYAVFGAGRAGTAAVYDLIKNCDARRVLVVEPNEERLRQAKERLAALLGDSHPLVDYASQAGAQEVAGVDAIVSCASHCANVALTRLAVELKIPICDLGGHPQTVAAQEALAAGNDVPVVPDCGISPGLSNCLAVHCARVHGATEIHVRCGGLPLERPDPQVNPLGYALLFSPGGLLSEYSGSVPAIRQGVVTGVPALSVTETFDEQHESSPTSNNSPQVVEHLARCGVTEYDYMTIRYKGHWDLVRTWKGHGCLCGDAERDAELARTLEADPALRFNPATDRDKLILRVTGARRENGLTKRVEYQLDLVSDRKTRFTAMELATSWGITIVAHHMVSGRGAPRGFATPERFVDTRWVISEVERRLAQVTR